MTTIASMIDKYNRKLAQVSPGQPERGYLIEQILDDLVDCVLQDSEADLNTITGAAYARGYNAAWTKIKHGIDLLLISDERKGNGG